MADVKSLTIHSTKYTIKDETARNNYSTLNSTVTGLTEDVEANTQKITALDSKIDDVNSDVSNNTNNINELRTDLDNNTNNINELRTDLDNNTQATNSAVSQLSSRITSNDSDISSIKTELNSMTIRSLNYANIMSGGTSFTTDGVEICSIDIPATYRGYDGILQLIGLALNVSGGQSAMVSFYRVTANGNEEQPFLEIDVGYGNNCMISRQFGFAIKEDTTAIKMYGILPNTSTTASIASRNRFFINVFSLTTKNFIA